MEMIINPFTQNQIIGSLEKGHMTKSRRNRYIALEEMDFVWDEDDVLEFRKMWNDGAGFESIAKHFDRDIDECSLLLMDLRRKGKLKPRNRGLF